MDRASEMENGLDFFCSLQIIRTCTTNNLVLGKSQVDEEAPVAIVPLNRWLGIRHERKPIIVLGNR